MNSTFTDYPGAVNVLKAGAPTGQLIRWGAALKAYEDYQRSSRCLAPMHARH